MRNGHQAIARRPRAPPPLYCAASVVTRTFGIAVTDDYAVLAAKVHPANDVAVDCLVLEAVADDDQARRVREPYEQPRVDVREDAGLIGKDLREGAGEKGREGGAQLEPSR